MAEPATTRIFLYGTLRRGGSRDAQKFYHGATFVSEARARGELYDLGSYPGFRATADGDWVTGELFDVTEGALAGLDEWEGIAPAAPEDRGEYRRIRMTAEGAAGPEECWGYEIAKWRCEGCPRIFSGDWIVHHAERLK